MIRTLGAGSSLTSAIVSKILLTIRFAFACGKSCSAAIISTSCPRDKVSTVADVDMRFLSVRVVVAKVVSAALTSFFSSLPNMDENTEEFLTLRELYKADLLDRMRVVRSVIVCCRYIEYKYMYCSCGGVGMQDADVEQCVRESSRLLKVSASECTKMLKFENRRVIKRHP